MSPTIFILPLVLIVAVLLISLIASYRSDLGRPGRRETAGGDSGLIVDGSGADCGGDGGGGGGCD